MFNSLRRLMFRLTRSANDTKLNFARGQPIVWPREGGLSET